MDSPDLAGHRSPNIAFNFIDNNGRIVRHILVDDLPITALWSGHETAMIPERRRSRPRSHQPDPARDEPSLHGEILTRLRDHIVEGNIPDGGRIPERQLCEMLGISRTPLREALKVLAAEGLVRAVAQSRRPGAALEVSAICSNCSTSWAGSRRWPGGSPAKTSGDTEIAEIERLHYEMYGCYLHRDMHGYFRVNQLIHQKIVEASGNATLRSAYASFAGRIRRVRYAANFARKRERWGEAMREHEAILEALRRRAGSELV